MEVVDDDAADAGGERLGQLLPRLVVAVEVDAFGREAGLERDVKLAAGDYVQVETFLGEKLGDGGAEVGLRGIRGLGCAGVVLGQRFPVGPGLRAQGFLVEDVQRRAEFIGERRRRAAAEPELAVVSRARGDRPELIHKLTSLHRSTSASILTDTGWKIILATCNCFDEWSGWRAACSLFFLLSWRSRPWRRLRRPRSTAVTPATSSRTAISILSTATRPRQVPEGWAPFVLSGDLTFMQDNDTVWGAPALRMWSNGDTFVAGIYTQVGGLDARQRLQGVDRLGGSQ